MEMHEKSAMSRRSFLAGGAVAAGAVGLALTGCGGSGGSSSSAAGSSSAAASGSAAAAGVITAANAYTSTNVNPIGLNGGSALMLAATWHVFEGLYDLDLHTYKPYASLADGEPVEVSDTEYEVSIRSGAKFSDGSDVTPDDVVNAFEVNIADDTIGPMLAFIDAVAAKDDSTVTITLKYPFASLLKARLTLVKVFPAALSDDELATKPIGSGPWMYESVNGDDGGEIVFKPNPNYNGPQPATSEEMRWSVLTDGTARTTALQEGSVAVIEAVPDANAEQLEAAGAEVEYIQGFSQAFLMFNCQKAPFDDYRVRQAFFYAIDTEKLIANQLAGHATPVTGFLPETFDNYSKASTVYTYDPEKAKALLEEAGVTDLKFEMMTNSNWVKDLAPQIQNDLAAIGVEMTNNETKIDWATLNADVPGILPFDVMLTPGDPTCFGNDPDLIMNWWYGDNVWTRGRSRWAEAGDGKFEELQELLQQGREATGSAQQDIWNQCFDLIAEQAPLYALFHRELATGVQTSMIEGFEPIGTTGLVFLGATAK